MKIIYRISDVGFAKNKPDYISNEKCLINAINAFPLETCDWLVLADSVCQETKNMIESYVPNVEYISIKNGPGFPFMYILDKTLQETKDENEIIYFIENDYIHKIGSDVIIKEGIGIGGDYVSLYDHPDKYLNANQGGNPFIEDGGEITRVILSQTCHWKLTNSTTGTFATTIKTLREDYDIIKKYANNVYWNDFHMFLELKEKGKCLITPIPGYATHGEILWLSPLTDWSKV